ncbi:sporulation protein [Georgenia subflava]|uniref:Sporulation protein n=2 Tax=Georgenia subflava TaxID=1622177 RepID=A0A6N7EET2_9MICO|nr:sporulation protein [Georgenia subflava]
MDKQDASVDLVTESARDALHVRRVFGEPYVSGEVTVIPVAKVMGGSGMGYGNGARGATDEAAGTEEGAGGGGGFGVRAKPAGVYVVREGKVQWQPALDVNRMALGGQILMAVAVVALSWALRKRRR